MLLDILLDGKTAVGIVGSLCLVITTLIVYVYQSNKSATHARIKRVEAKQDEIVDNYLSRFYQVNKNISETKSEILEKLHQLHIQITRKE